MKPTDRVVNQIKSLVFINNIQNADRLLLDPAGRERENNLSENTFWGVSKPGNGGTDRSIMSLRHQRICQYQLD